MATVQEIAEKMLELYGGDPGRWTRLAYAQDAEGNACRVLVEHACCWCFAGARDRACYDLDAEFEESEAFTGAAERALGLPVTAWNDASGRTFADVERLLKQLALP